MTGNGRRMSRRDCVRSATSALALGAMGLWSSAGGQEMAGDVVLELRQYALRVGQRETLVSLFEKECVTPQIEAGGFVRGTFSDLADPDRFV